MAKGDNKIPVEMLQRARAEMYSAVDRLWKFAPDDLTCVRVQMTFRGGKTIGQRRQLPRILSDGKVHLGYRQT